MQFSKSLDILYLDLCTSTIPAGITSIIIQASCVEQCKFPDQGLKVLVNMAPTPVEQYRADMPAVFYVVTRSQNQCVTALLDTFYAEIVLVGAFSKDCTTQLHPRTCPACLGRSGTPCSVDIQISAATQHKAHNCSKVW